MRPIKIAIILTSALFLFGCATQETGEKKVTISFMNAEGTRAQIEVMQEIVRGFEALNPDIKVKLEWGVRPEKILTSIAAGSPPDVFMWWRGIYDLQKRGALMPLNTFIEKYNVDMSKYFKCLVDYYTYNGELYAFPLQLKTMALVYNKTIFDEANIPYPDETWTWDDYYRVAKALTQDLNNDGRIDQFGTDLPEVYTWILLNGGSLVDPETNRSSLDSPAARQALEFLIKLKRDACPSDAERSAFGGQAGTQGFMMGKIAMQISMAWELAAFSNIKNFEWDVAPVPRPPGQKTYIFDDAGLAISAGSKHPEEAFRFIQYYCGIEGMKLFGKSRNGIPALKEAAYGVFLEPPPYNLKYFLESAERATLPVVPRIDRWREISHIFGQEVSLVFLGRKDLDEAIKKIVLDTNKLLSGNK